MNIFKPHGFLKVGGVILLVLGILGYLLPEGVLIKDVIWFDSGENIAHTVLGVIAIILGFTLPGGAAKVVTVLVGLVALFFGVIGFFLEVPAEGVWNFYGLANLENPADNVLHLVVAVWALVAGFSKGNGGSAM